MYARIQSTVLTTVAAAGAAALVAAPVTAPAQLHAPRVVNAQIQLTASPPLGAIPLAFLRNQVLYCSVICPFVVQGAITVPLAAVQTPVTFLDALAATGSLPRAVGMAAASVTGAANDAAEGIILNDVNRVVPKAFNTLEIAVVQLMRVGSAVLTPAELPDAVNTARETVLAALNQPLPGPGVPVPTETGAETLPEVVAVEAIKVTAAVAFQAGELLLLGVVQTVDAGAQELARSGDPLAAVSAAAAQATEVVDVASDIVSDSVDTAVTNIRGALDNPFRTARPTTETPRAEVQSASASSADAPPPARRVHREAGRAATQASATAEPSKTADRPVRKLVRDVSRTVRSVTGSLADAPRKTLQHNKSEDSKENRATHDRSDKRAG
ncbi:hypothetical protein AFM11_09420 [Mycolicibacterium wolinskyi]|uniref:Uncharacterized protein n=1 Tax=Mycolicibacterium wolinskyi TaxID=59750 RepID=A0A132PPE1_9MYCO|nr:hypothetical protein [Mycolicibacterium wolinskyi]KWX24209.1 hypothetical protein AFM11_09420 [Mycolicibacterium wolinskyi]